MDRLYVGLYAAYEALLCHNGTIESLVLYLFGMKIFSSIFIYLHLLFEKFHARFRKSLYLLILDGYPASSAKIRTLLLGKKKSEK